MNLRRSLRIHDSRINKIMSTNYVKAFRLLSKMLIMHLDLNYFTSSLCEVFGFVIRNIYIRHVFPYQLYCMSRALNHDLLTLILAYTYTYKEYFIS